VYFKALLLGDNAVAEKILVTKGPGEIKALGRGVSNFDHDVWNANCDGVVERANFLKFSQDKRLKKMLMGTGDREIVVTSPNDRVWVTGFDSEHALDSVKDWGEDKLGKALVRIREQLARRFEPKSAFQ